MSEPCQNYFKEKKNVFQLVPDTPFVRLVQTS